MIRMGCLLGKIDASLVLISFETSIGLCFGFSILKNLDSKIICRLGKFMPGKIVYLGTNILVNLRRF